MDPLKLGRHARLSCEQLEDRSVPAVIGHEFVDSAKFTTPGLRAESFNSTFKPLKIAMRRDAFLVDPATVVLKINGQQVSSADFKLSAHLIKGSNLLVDGKNSIELSALNKNHYPIKYTTTIWAGSSTLRVKLLKADGKPFMAGAKVTAKMGDDQSIVKTVVGQFGSAIFRNVPNRTVFLEAQAGKYYGFVGDYGGVGTTELKLSKLGTPSTVDNNDFSLGIAGWETGSAPVQIVEGDGSGQKPSKIDDPNLLLSTSGEGEQSIFRTFETDPGVAKVTVRYRFITSEVPGGFFGSKFNDYFAVTVRAGVQEVTDGNTMNGLGLGAFDFATGTTAWREVEFNVDPEGDVVLVEATVANVADGLYDSSVEIDMVKEEQAEFQLALAWNTSASGGVDLTYTVIGTQDVQQDTPVKIYWASGTSYNNQISEIPGAAVTIPNGTTAGTTKTVRIPGESLQDSPVGTTHILAATTETDATALQDVVVSVNAGIDGTLLGATTYRVLKNAARIAGEADINISSTARTIEAQVSAMFNNLTEDAEIEENIAEQNAIYDANGEAVIAVFAAQAAAVGNDLQQIQANSAAIQAAMVAEIESIKQQNENAFKHTISAADYANYNVIDVPRSGFTNANTRQHFETAITGMVTRILDENGVFHLEITQ